MPPFHPKQGLEVRCSVDDIKTASIMDALLLTPDVDKESGRQPDFLVDDEDYFEFHPRTVMTINTVVYPENMGDVERMAGCRAESLHIEFPNSLDGLLAWTVTIEGTELLQEDQQLVTGPPTDDTGPWMLISNNIHTQKSRHLQGAYSALSDRVGRWPKTNEEAQQLVDAWSAEKLLSSGIEIPGLMVASTVEIGAVKDIVDGLQRDGVDEAVVYKAEDAWRIMSYVPVSERAPVSELHVASAKTFHLDLMHVGAAGGA